MPAKSYRRSRSSYKSRRFGLYRKSSVPVRRRSVYKRKYVRKSKGFRRISKGFMQPMDSMRYFKVQLRGERI